LLKTVIATPFTKEEYLKAQLAFLQHLNQPLFLILRNLNGQRLPDRGPFVLPHLQGELVGLTRSFESAQKLIPRPEYPANHVLQQQFHERFGWRNLPLSDGTLLQQIPDVKFDHRPRRESIQNDRELFGDSFTILWVSPLNQKLIVDHLLTRTKQLLSQQAWEQNFAFSIKKKSVLDQVRAEQLDRLCLSIMPLAELDLTRFQSEIKELFRSRLSSNSVTNLEPE